MQLDSIRREYKLAVLNEESIEVHPVLQFEKWMKEALKAEVNEPTAMSVSTFGLDKFPQSRVVLLKGADKSGFYFFTNYNSNKGREIKKNAAVSLLFFWPELEREIRVSGFAEKVGKQLSDQYFKSRPYLSQVAALVSEQSIKIPSREYLEILFDHFKKNMKEDELKRPENWGGYLVKPVKIEFWQGRENRLHDRILYEKIHSEWKISRLAP